MEGNNIKESRNQLHSCYQSDWPNANISRTTSESMNFSFLLNQVRFCLAMVKDRTTISFKVTRPTVQHGEPLHGWARTRFELAIFERPKLRLYRLSNRSYEMKNTRVGKVCGLGLGLGVGLGREANILAMEIPLNGD